MASDPSSGYFTSLILGFVFFILVLLLANCTVLLFLGWEGVGVVSFLLISFWQTRQPAVQSAVQAFVLNRVGDMALLLALVCLLASSGLVESTTLSHVDQGSSVLVY